MSTWFCILFLNSLTPSSYQQIGVYEVNFVVAFTATAYLFALTAVVVTAVGQFFPYYMGQIS